MDHRPETEDWLQETEGPGDIPGGERPRRGFREGVVAGILAALLCAAVFSCGDALLGRLLRGSGDGQEGAAVLTSGETLDKLREVQRLIQSSYLNDVDGDLLSAYLFRGIAVGLDDDYARYFTREELDSQRESNHGAYQGIGITLTEQEDGRFLVTTVYRDGPADRAGMEEGDFLAGYNEVSFQGMELTEVIDLIRGSEGPFSVTVLRDGEELHLEMECGPVEKDTVEYELKEPGIGYIRISEFATVTVGQFQEAVEALMLQGADRLVVDLRDNPGGLLDSVCEILDYLLPEGLIVYTEDRGGRREEYRSDGEHSVDCRFAVLVNGNSASASEIFAGAIQDYEMGVIVGEKTYGKGVVQDTYFLSDGSGFKMTVEKYYTPAGQDIEGNGITPDLAVEEEEDEDGDPVLAKALEALRDEKK